MRRGIWITVLAVVAFAAIVIARLPASWVIPAPSPAFACADIYGSIWSGTCAGLTARGGAVGDLTWNVHGLRLLIGKLSANILLTRPGGSVHGDFDFGLDKSLTLRNVQASLPIDQSIKTLLPALRSMSGTANANIASAHLVNDVVKQIQGRIEVHDLDDRDSNGITPLGSYAVTFPGGGGGDPMGQLQDIGGPLSVQGTLRLMQDKPGLELNGYVTPRADAAPGLRQQLQYLGSPDAQGRRQFGPITFTF